MEFIRRIFVPRLVDKEDRKFITPHFPGGVVKPADLRKIADMCERFPESRIKLTGEMVIGGVKDERRNDEFREALGLNTTSVAGFSVRTVKACSGGYVCDNNLRETLPLSLRLDEKFHGVRLPFKLVISVSGCQRSCSEPLVKDIGIIASRTGYSVYVGGAAGAKPRIGIKIIEEISEEDVIEIVSKVIDLYGKKARTAERLGLFIERTGFEVFKKEVLTSFVPRQNNEASISYSSSEAKRSREVI